MRGCVSDARMLPLYSRAVGHGTRATIRARTCSIAGAAGMPARPSRPPNPLVRQSNGMDWHEYIARPVDRRLACGYIVQMRAGSGRLAGWMDPTAREHTRHDRIEHPGGQVRASGPDMICHDSCESTHGHKNAS